MKEFNRESIKAASKNLSTSVIKKETLKWEELLAEVSEDERRIIKAIGPKSNNTFTYQLGVPFRRFLDHLYAEYKDPIIVAAIVSETVRKTMKDEYLG